MRIKTINSILIPAMNLSSLSSAPCSLKAGDVLKKSRTFTESDVLDYSKLTHDSNPLHFDSECAQRSGFDDKIVHGMLIAALFPRIIASHFPGAIYASQSLQFKLPVYIGEEVMAEVTALRLRVNKDTYMLVSSVIADSSPLSLTCVWLIMNWALFHVYRSKFSTRCYKDGKLLCFDGEAVALLPTLTMDAEGGRRHNQGIQ